MPMKTRLVVDQFGANLSLLSMASMYFVRCLVRYRSYDKMKGSSDRVCCTEDSYSAHVEAGISESGSPREHVGIPGLVRRLVQVGTVARVGYCTLYVCTLYVCTLYVYVPRQVEGGEGKGQGRGVRGGVH